ncbi:uncharacterized protein MONBRDRAFT_36918 [Monosiga brevicollis MX1]|uniref:RNA helicase n=1 Tax=Monosiga brevicollis TaxID=81824 RepID=A9UYD6_MONBE|nr:uncharacterized protein MONBRDRAFT_36918 [Monosiga brevicollis MX1]EDQ89444.1 predicted protein [Monosiga brevicollis MX1]|eukprot:XP_001745473.1 hypothetical protein [Monosiga brevicollis MX1]
MADIHNDEDLLEYTEEAEPETTGTKDVAKDKGSYAGAQTAVFRDFLLKPELLRAITECGFEHPSEVQQECIPQAILGGDVLCQAKSGMGKTAVFVISTLQQLEREEGKVNVLVSCHTRELAYQIAREYERFSKFFDPVPKTAVFYGGTPIGKDEKVLRDDVPNIVVGTPGRLKALVNSGALKLSNVKHFILDECDKMLDQLDMRRDVQEIFLKTPVQKQVMMFSATLSKTSREVCKKFMDDPMEVSIDDDAKLTLHGLKQHYVKLLEEQKNRKLLDLLDALEFNQVVIFVKSGRRAETLSALLQDQMFPATHIHGGRMPQAKRLERYQQFKNFEKRILVATDVFGRGMDIERVNIVINYDMPEDTEESDASDTYLHRVARAGRFGTKGLAVSFVSTDEDATVLNKVQDRFAVQVTDLPENLEKSLYMEDAA